jgi:hypothetical protein
MAAREQRKYCEYRSGPVRADSPGWCRQREVTLENTGRPLLMCLSFDLSFEAAGTDLAHSSWLDQELVRLRT